VGNYTGYLIAAMMAEYPEWKYLLYSNRPLELEPALGRAVVVNGQKGPSRWLWMQASLPHIVAETRPDLCHFTNSLAPLWLKQPYVLSIHDASLYLYSRYHPRARLLAVRLFLPAAARRAAAVITMSHSARRDLLRVLKLEPANVHVVHEAAHEVFRPLADSAELDALRSKYRLSQEFLLYAGTIEPRKNLSRLVRALAQLHRDGTKVPLVIVGPWGWAMDSFCREISDLGLKESVRMLGYVPRQDLRGLYSLASVFAFPSLYEGFGLPPLEAMACGAPVLTSNNSSLSEICGDAAWLVDPNDESDIVTGLRTLLDQPELRSELGRRGLARSSSFSWKRTAVETMAVYRQVMAGQGQA
jgi:glycosyltransferase involved in cell wall biosynthesis